MPDVNDKAEQWFDATSHSLWERNPVTKIFSVVYSHEKRVDKRWRATDIAKVLNCAISNSPDDGASVLEFVTFPPEFKYSPNNGKQLLRTEGPKANTWLPVCGSENLNSGLTRGGCLTSHPLRVKDACLTRNPDRELPLPGRGYFKFCVGAFGLSSNFLLALEAAQGEIFCWIPSAHEWAQLTPASEDFYLGAETFSRRSWSIDARELTGETILYWPSDCGLFAIKVDILSLSYEVRLLVEGHCISVPRILKNKVYFLIEKPDGTVRAMSVDTDWHSTKTPLEMALNSIPATEYVMSAVTPREVIWLSQMGQVVLRPSAQQYLVIPWEPGVEPQFRMGGPHCSTDGNLYMQVLHPTLHGGESGFGFTQLARSKIEREPKKTFCARMLTGRSSIRGERCLKGDPWVEPIVVAQGIHQNDEAVIPILESVNENTLLVLRVNHLQGLTQLFERTGEMFSTRFQIMGEDGGDVFYAKRLREPWNTTAFIFDGSLYIYHPDIESIPGWVISKSGA